MGKNQATFTILGVLALALAACGQGPAAATAAGTLVPTATSPPISPRPTEVPLKAVVNDEGITVEAFEAHLARYLDAQAGAGTNLATEEAEQTVLDDLINRLLLAQAARQDGFSADEALVEDRLNRLVEAAGGQGAFNAWLEANHYTPQSFRSDLALEIEAAWMREQIAAQVPQSAEQVLARQVLLYSSFEAERLLDQLENGASFDTIVANNDPQGLGNLGWFPRGYLLQPELEQAAFSLQPGEHSGVVETEVGFHILQVLDRDPDRPLTADARLALQSQHLQEWLENRRRQSRVEIFLP